MQKVAFFDIGDTLGTVRIVQAGGPANDFGEEPSPSKPWANFSPQSTTLKLDVFPGVADALVQLRDNGVLCGIVSRIGEFDPYIVDRMLEDAGLLGFFRQQEIDDPDSPTRVELINYLRGDTPKDKAAFEAALAAAGHAHTPTDCVFVGEDPTERREARLAGLLVTSDPRHALDVLTGRHLAFIKLTRPKENSDEAWHEVLRKHSLKRLYETGEQGSVMYTVGPPEAVEELGADKPQYKVEILGSIDAPFTSELYLLRDVPPPPAGFAGDDSRFAPGFESEEAQTLIVDKTDEGIFVALPSGQSIEDYHFEGVRHHGHNLKLTPPSDWFRPVGFGRDALPTAWLGAASGEAAFDSTPLRLTDGEVRIFKDEITESLIRRDIERYSREISTSRHIRHAGNRRAVRQLTEDLKEILGNESVRPHAFVHEGRRLENVIAEIPGRATSNGGSGQTEIVIISAHLDSTGANAPTFRPETDTAPGADDDASGIAAVLAAARALKKLRDTVGTPGRTIRFALFNAEEHGLVGSRAYANDQRTLVAPIVAVYQMDMIGYNRVPPAQYEVHAGYAPRREVQDRSLVLANLVAQIAPQVSAGLPAPEIFPPSPQESDPADRRSDHASFQMAGYAACVISEDFFRGPGAGSSGTDANPHYHLPSDVISELNISYMADVARVVAAVAWVTADRMSAQPHGFSANKEINMAKDFDSRNFSFIRPNETASGFESDRPVVVSMAAKETSARLTVSGVNSMTGTPSSFSTAESSQSLFDRALSLVGQSLTASGFESDEPAEFVPDPHIQETSAGVKIVRVHQFHRGIPVFQMSRKVEFPQYEQPRSIAEGDSIPPPVGLEISPKLDILDAVKAALEYVRAAVEEEIETAKNGPADPFDLPPDEKIDTTAFAPLPPPEPPNLKFDGYVPEVAMTFTWPSRPTMIGWKQTDAGTRSPVDWGPLADFIQANLTVFYQGEATRLGWEMIISLADSYKNLADQYRIIVAADVAGGDYSPELLYRKQTIHQVRANGKVYPFRPADTPNPVDTIFPVDLTSYNIARDLAPSISDREFGRPDWVAVDSTVGNNVVATKGFSSTVFTGRPQNGTIVLNPSNDDDQKILNIFYFCNYMHDFLYLLGFDEASGNFQQINYTGSGLPADPVSAHAHPMRVNGTANMSTLPDGRPPEMNMGITAINRHTAFDADVVFHEFCHGLTNRLVGGRMDTSALEQPQSDGMGEGWGDYFALTIQNFNRDVRTERIVTGNWVTGRSTGIRLFPYGPRKTSTLTSLGLDASRRFPDGFGNLSSGRYPLDEHNRGEIWCAALMHMNRMIGVRVGNYQRGHQIGWQIVVDGLKLTRTNPSFLNARDAILKALDDLRASGRMNNVEHARARLGAWEAFAEFGMGFSARCPNASLEGIVAAEDLPPGLI